MSHTWWKKLVRLPPALEVTTNVCVELLKTHRTI